MTIESRLSALRTAAPPSVEVASLLGTGVIDGYSLFDSQIGQVAIAFNPAGVSSVDLADEETEERFVARFGRRVVPARPPKGWDALIARAIDRGTPGSLPIDWRSVTAFQHSVLEKAASIPRGQVRSYGWLARHVEKEGAVRAVGSTMARNPVPLIVPCHRVVRADGTIGQYSLGGPHRKRELLEHEGIDPAWLESLASRGVRYFGSDTTGVYCNPTCAHARRITPPHLVEFSSADAARNAGYRACRVCEP
jgi:O-6-methylguanine DNA methyltransferase